MPETFYGLPLHPLIVHAAVVVVPTAALVLALALLLPRFRAWAGILPLGLAAAAVILTPLSTSTGESLEHMVGESALVEEHAELGEMLIYWTIGLLVVAAAAFLLRRGGREPGRGVAIALVVAGCVVAAGTLVQVGLIGHSGAKSAWEDVAKSPTSQTSDDDDD